MARKLDRILVVDVEATCWEGDPPPGQISAIIEKGTHHRGGDDAWNIAAILGHVLRSGRQH